VMVAKRFGFLYDAYKPHLWWWEVVVMSQKLLLTGLIVFIRPDTAAQIAAGFMISIGYLVLHVQNQPFAEDQENTLQFLSELAITLTMFCGICLKVDVTDEDPYGEIVLRVLLFGVNVSFVLFFLYLCCHDFGTTASAALQRVSSNVANKSLQYARAKVVKYIGAFCEQKSIDPSWLRLLIKLIDVAEDRVSVFTEQCKDHFEFICMLDKVTSADDARNVANNVWLLLIEMLGHDMVEQHTAELAESSRATLQVALEGAVASERTQIVAAAVVEAGVSFAVLSGLGATIQEGENFVAATGVRKCDGLLHVNLAKLEAELNRLLVVFCTPEVTARVTLRMVPVLRQAVQGHAWILDKMMEPAHIQLTVMMLDEIERVANDAQDTEGDNQALCIQLVTCCGLSEMPALLSAIFQLACTVLGEEQVKIMYQAVLRTQDTEACEMPTLKWLSSNGVEPSTPIYQALPMALDAWACEMGTLQCQSSNRAEPVAPALSRMEPQSTTAIVVASEPSGSGDTGFAMCMMCTQDRTERTSTWNSHDEAPQV